MKTKTKLKTFTVEFTSGNPVCPAQIEVVAANQADAVQKALDRGGFNVTVQPYDASTDQRGSYTKHGWAHFTISVDEGV